MNPSGREHWFRTTIVIGLLYAIVGVALGAFAGWSASHQMVVAWRLAAWVISAITFGAHIWFERIRFRNSAFTTAMRASLAAALGAFGLAVAANGHRLWAGSNHGRALNLALILWPVLVVIPAFVFAFMAAAALGLLRQERT